MVARFGAAWYMLRQNWQPLIGVTVLYTIATIGFGLLYDTIRGEFLLPFSDITVRDWTIYSVCKSYLFAFLYAIWSAAVAYVLFNAKAGRKSSTFTAYCVALRRLPTLFWICMTATTLTIIGWTLFIPLGLWIMIKYVFVYMSCMDDNLPALDARTRSWVYSEGLWLTIGAIYAITFAATISFGVLSAILFMLLEEHGKIDAKIVLEFPVRLGLLFATLVVFQLYLEVQEKRRLPGLFVAPVGSRPDEPIES